MTPKFKAKIQKGKVIPSNPQALEDYYKNFEGQDIAITIKKWSSIRSEQQNRYIHGVVFKMIAEDMGVTIEEAKKHTKVAIGFFDQFEIYGEKIIALKETSKLSKKDFNDFVEEARVFAMSKLNLHIPLPDEVDYDELYYMYNS